MKRILALLFVLLLLLLLVSCQDEQECFCGTGLMESRRVEVESYEEYRALMELFTPIPTGFIPYEHVSFLGEFSYFSCNFDFMPNLVHLGGYRVIDGSGEQFEMRYVHLYEYDETLQNEHLEVFDTEHSFDEVIHEENSIQVIKPYSGNSTILPNMPTSYKRNNIVFQYKERKVPANDGTKHVILTLDSITWVYNGTLFEIYQLVSYPENAEGTFVSRLLNPDTVDAAVAEFNLRVKGY